MTGAEFRDHRINVLKMSATKLANVLSVTRKTIYNWESMPQIPTTIELAIQELTRRVNKTHQSVTV